MRIIVTHATPDLDAITSAWLIKRFFPGWENATVKFVPAGDRLNLESAKISPEDYPDAIETIGEDEIIHVDTGLGALDHHQTQSDKICAASLTLDFVLTHAKLKEEKIGALRRMVKVIVDLDHFKEVYRADAAADYHEFDLFGIIEGINYQKPGEYALQAEFIMANLDAILHNFENRVWAEKELLEKGLDFNVREGLALAIESINDSVIKLAQKKGYALVVRRDPKTGAARIKANPKADIDLTRAYEELKKRDPNATWFLHVGKKMLLNGTSKNPKMKPTKLSLQEIVEVIKQAYSV